MARAISFARPRSDGPCESAGPPYSPCLDTRPHSRMESRVIERALASWFGPLVSRVGGLLARRGPLTLPALLFLSHGDLSPRTAKEALFVLLQHSFCTWRSLGFLPTAPDREQIEYRLDAGRVKLVIIGFPWLHHFAVTDTDPGAGEYVQEVAVMGMVRTAGTALETKLLELGVIEPVAGLEIRQVEEVDASPSRKRQRTTATDCQASDRFLRLSKQGIIALWQRHLAAELARSFVNGPAAKIVTLLSRGPPNGMSFASVGASLGQTLKVSQSDGRPAAFHYLEVLARRFSFVTRQAMGGTIHYKVDHRLLLDEAEREAIAAIVGSRFSTASARIVRFLLSEGPQDDRVVGEKLLMTAKEVRERCFQLLAAGLVHLQEVPRSIDHAPARTFFLWSIPLWLVRGQVLLRFSELRMELYAELDSYRQLVLEEQQKQRDQTVAKMNALTLDAMLFDLQHQQLATDPTRASE